jgi:DNA-binding response OmpR family regulator
MISSATIENNLIVEAKDEEVSKSKILLIEDEIDLGNVVKQYLEVMDFEVDWCTNGKSAYEKFKKTPGGYSILLIDINLPEINGFELAGHINAHPNCVPFLFLTARNEKSDRLQGLKLGADDYITKPFDIDELVLRIRNIIKRSQPGASPAAPACLQIGDLRFYKESLKLVLNKQNEVILTPREAELLEYLFKNPNRVIKREEILHQLWGENDYFLGRSLDVFISRLRKYLVNNEYASINNIYGVGFIFAIKNG